MEGRPLFDAELHTKTGGIIHINPQSLSAVVMEASWEEYVDVRFIFEKNQNILSARVLRDDYDKLIGMTR